MDERAPLFRANISSFRCLGQKQFVMIFLRRRPDFMPCWRVAFLRIVPSSSRGKSNAARHFGSSTCEVSHTWVGPALAALAMDVAVTVTGTPDDPDVLNSLVGPWPGGSSRASNAVRRSRRSARVTIGISCQRLQSISPFFLNRDRGGFYRMAPSPLRGGASG